MNDCTTEEPYKYDDSWQPPMSRWLSVGEVCRFVVGGEQGGSINPDSLAEALPNAKPEVRRIAWDLLNEAGALVRTFTGWTLSDDAKKRHEAMRKRLGWRDEGVPS